MSWSVSEILKPFKKLTVVNYQNLTFKPDKTPLLGFFFKDSTWLYRVSVANKWAQKQTLENKNNM